LKRQPECFCATAIKSKNEARKSPRKYKRENSKYHKLFKWYDEYELEKLHNLHATTTEENTLEYEGDEAYVIAGRIMKVNLHATLDS